MSESVVPFVARLSSSEHNLWLTAFADSLLHVQPCLKLIPFDDLSRIQRQEATVAVVANPDPVKLLSLPRLKWVYSVWAGVEKMIQDLPDFPFTIVRLRDPQMAHTMAEAVLAWTLYLFRDMPHYLDHQQYHQWHPAHISPPLCQETSVGLLGLGHLGSMAASYLARHGFQVSGCTRQPRKMDGVTTHTGSCGLETVLRTSQILVLLMPLTPHTRKCLNAQTLALMPKGASLINFARGGLIEDQDLRAALDSGHINHAVLDVFDTEPLPPDDPYWSHPRVTVLPHISGPTHIPSAVQIVTHALCQYVTEGEIPPGVDPVTLY